MNIITLALSACLPILALGLIGHRLGRVKRYTWTNEGGYLRSSEYWVRKDR